MCVSEDGNDLTCAKDCSDLPKLISEDKLKQDSKDFKIF